MNQAAYLNKIQEKYVNDHKITYKREIVQSTIKW